MPFGLFSFIFFCERAVADGRLPTKSTSRILIFGPSPTLKVTFTELRTAGDRRDLVVTSALVKPFSAIISSQHAFDATDRALVEERVEAHLDVPLAQLARRCPCA